MEKKQKLKVEVEVWGIEVEETHKYSNGQGSGWWKFEYRYRVSGKRAKDKWIYGESDGSWSSQTKKEFMKTMKGGYPALKVLEEIY